MESEFFSEDAKEDTVLIDTPRSSQNWLLYTRYVRGEHEKCNILAEKLLTEFDNCHAYAYFVQGLILSDSGKYQEAIDKFHNSVRLQPHDPEPIKEVAKVLFLQNRYKLSLEAYLEAQRISPFPDPEILCGLAECAWKLDELSKACEWAREATGCGGEERAGALLARLLHAAGDTTAALVAYDQILASNACGAETLAAAGALWLRSGDPRKAFQLLGAALALQPTHHQAAIAMAAMMLQHRDYDAALSRLKAALTMHPTCVAAYLDLGLALLTKKKYVAALTCLQRAAWLAPLSAGAAHDLGLALLVARRNASAFCRLAAAIALQANPHPHTLLLLAIALERLKDGRADAAYNRAVTAALSDPLVRLNLAGRHARAGRQEEAVQEARVTAELLGKEEKPDPYLSSSLATLFGLLREHSSWDRNEPLPVPAIQAADSEQQTEAMSPDEV